VQKASIEIIPDPRRKSPVICSNIDIDGNDY
jgi:hypothetical protein